MEEIVKKIIKTGYGLGLLSLSEAKRVAGIVKKELNLDEKESLKLARELVANSQKASRDVLKTAGKHLERSLVKSGAANRRDIKIAKKLVKKRVQEVKKRVLKRIRKK